MMILKILWFLLDKFDKFSDFMVDGIFEKFFHKIDDAYSFIKRKAKE